MTKKKYSKKKANKKDSQINNTVSEQTQTIVESNIKPLTIRKRKIDYRLVYADDKSIDRFKTDELIDYFNKNYIDRKEFSIKNISLDIENLKVYSDKLSNDINNISLFCAVISIIITCAGILSTIVTDVNLILFLVMYGLLAVGVILLQTVSKNVPGFKKLVVNSIIYKLETIKEELESEKKD